MNFKLNKVLAALMVSAFSISALAQPTLEEIVVTATKRETNLQDTPISMTVETAEKLEQRHIQSLLDLGDGSVPGLNVATFEARQTALTVGIRGIVPLDANQPAREQGVGIYIDGVYLGRQHGLNAALLDVERIEVLKGPQGTLFGRNTSGGALSIVTKRPTGEFDSDLKAGVGNFGSNTFEAHVNLPSIANVATKVDFIQQYQDPTVKNPLEGEKGWNYFDRTGVRFSAEWQGDRTEVYYTADYGTDKNTPFYSQLLNFDPLNKGLPALPKLIVVNGESRMTVADIGVPQAPSMNKTAGHGLTVTVDTDWGFEFKSISAWRKVDSEQWDNSGGAHRVPAPKPNGIFSRYSLSMLEQDQVSQEFQIVGSTDTIEYVTGVYYFKESAWEEAATPSTNKWNSTMTGYTINDPATWAYKNWFIDRGSRATSESAGVFGQMTYTNLNLPDWHFTLGGRQTIDQKQGMLYKVRNLNANWNLDLQSSRFNPLFIVAYDATDSLNLYAKYATGYRAGGASSRSLSFGEFGPEDVESYELGAKFQGDRTRINAAVYTMDRTGSQIDFSQVVFDPVTKSTRNTLETLNAPGVTTIDGFEIDAQFAVTDQLQLSAAYTYTSAVIPETVNPFTGNLQEVFIVFTPENVYNVAADYTTYFNKFALRAHVDISKSDGAHAFSEYTEMNDEHTITNASVNLEDIQLGNGIANVQFWVRNLTDETYVYRRDPLNATQLGYYGNLNPPRMYGVTVGYKI
jgi:iron complex outermembrane receptor protein